MPTTPKLLENLLPPSIAMSLSGVNKITTDSRMVEPRDIFVALKGQTFNGEDSIPSAVSKGAEIIVVSNHYNGPEYPGVCFIKTDDPYDTLSILASRFFPHQPETTVAITGTNGKSSVVHFLRNLWGQLGYVSASIGTLGLIIQKNGIETVERLIHTSPQALEFHKILTHLADQGITHCAFEASSHGLDQHRVTRAQLSAAAFTTFGRDHLDYHPDMESYFKAKASLFQKVLPIGKPAVLNADIPEFDCLKDICIARGCPILSYGEHGDLCIKSYKPTPGGQRIVLEYKNQTYDIDLPLVGLFQAQNVLCALGLALSCGAPLDLLIKAIPNLPCVPGRMELAGTTPNGAPIYVDYSHKPEALETALKTLRPSAVGKLHVVFGCGGDRDTGKRPIMGAVAHQYADVVYVTNDNPRSEDPNAIRQQILATTPNAHNIADRRSCILQALKNLGPQDILLVAGKGHESGQIIGKTILPFDDRIVVKELLIGLNS